MTEPQFAALRAAVNTARNERITSVAKLRIRLTDQGYPAEDIEAALGYWTRHAESAR